jgi:acyl-CoA reductase-like NAD-dependent aldehyde dehydrogenase/nicotinamidase-related amidase
MTEALLLVDIQNDFLERAGLRPPAKTFVQRAQRLLKHWRELSLPVIHVQTLVRPDGKDRMPHWIKKSLWSCVEGTPGSRPPRELEPLASERIFRKRYYSAFEGQDLELHLKDLGVDHLIVAGLDLPGSVRSTVLDAYARGYTVWVAREAAASVDRVHDRVSRNFLSQQASLFLTSAEILHRCAKRKRPSVPAGAGILPGAIIGGKSVMSPTQGIWDQRDPSAWDKVAARVALAGAPLVKDAVAAARQAHSAWAGLPVSRRALVIEGWADLLAAEEDGMARTMAGEIGKPFSMARDEVRFAIRLLRAAAGLDKNRDERKSPAAKLYSRHCPRGLVGLVTPWNNPVAIPAGKIGPALIYGNAVIWKPALQAPRTTLLLCRTLSRAGFPQGLVNLLFGGPSLARDLISREEIPFISFTGSISAGREVAALCGLHGKTLQAELGGNNAAIVLPDADIPRAAEELAYSAFAYAGQRCTATRRFIVHRKRAREFRDALLTAIAALPLGHPMSKKTVVGPVISREKRASLAAIVHESLAQGGRLLIGGRIPGGWEAGCWYEPTLIEVFSSDQRVVQEETFGPLALWQEVGTLDEALRALNSVSQGLVASLYSQDPGAWRLFQKQAECGVLKLNQPTAGVDSSLPFGGWKSSGIGPPEHGPGDVESYTRWQAVYADL